MDERWRRRESASDLTQSVCRDLLEHAGRFQYPDSEAFRRWMFTTAVRKLRDRQDYYRAARRDWIREEVPADTEHHQSLLERYSKCVTPSQNAVALEELALVERALELLPEDYREVITLARIAGLSHATIALEMGRGEGAVRMLLQRALARLAVEVERLRSRQGQG